MLTNATAHKVNSYNTLANSYCTFCVGKYTIFGPVYASKPILYRNKKQVVCGVMLLFRCGSRILHGRVSNPSERGTGGRAPKAPRGSGLVRGLCPLPRKFCISYIKMVSFYAFLVIFIDTVLFKKGTPIKRAGVLTPWTPPGSAPAIKCSAFAHVIMGMLSWACYHGHVIFYG